MNRNDVIKLIAQQLQDDVRASRAEALESLHTAMAAFLREAEDYALRMNAAQYLYMANHTGGNMQKMRALVHYRMTDEEMSAPRDHFRVTIRDGQPWEQTFEFTTDVQMDAKLIALRDSWLTAAAAHKAAFDADERMSGVKPEAWKIVVDAMLDGTEVGREAKAALSELRKELKHDGYSALADKLGVEHVTEE